MNERDVNNSMTTTYDFNDQLLEIDNDLFNGVLQGWMASNLYATQPIPKIGHSRKGKNGSDFSVERPLL